MGFAIGQPVVWPARPEWSTPVTESRAWLTDVMQASATAMQQVRKLRAVPRRSFDWQSLQAGDERRLVDAVRRQIGVRQFLLPVYPDVQWLSAALAAGATGVDCNTDGFDFVAGGQAVLWRDHKTWELVTVDSIGSGALTFTAPTTGAWGLGDRLYPVRKARLAKPPQETQQNDDVSTLHMQALIDEPCDWPAAWPSSTTYRGVPVLDWRGEESEDPTDEYARVSGTVDADTGPVYYYDLPAQPFRSQSHRLQLAGRADHKKFWSLCYQLAGRADQCWVPDWQMSVRLAQAVTATGTQLTVAWQGYTQFDFVQVNRRDLRIELQDGTALYRRVTGSAETGDNEVLQLDSALGVDVGPSAIRQINWMSLCAQANDTVQLQHVVDDAGVNVATLNFQALANDV